MKSRIIGAFKEINNEIFVDTVKASIDAYVFIGDNGWKYIRKSSRWFYFKEVKKDGQSVRFYFYPDSNQKDIDPKTGTLFMEFSLPKFLYDGINISGVLISDKERLYSEVKTLLFDNDIYIDGEGLTRDYHNFDVRKIDYSISFDAGSQKEKEEFFRLFRKMHFPYHKAGMLCNKEYDYESSFCHGSNSTDIVLYDKTEEVEKNAGQEIKDNICRLEIRCKNPIKVYNDFGLVKDLFEKGNKTLINLLKAYRFDLDILPKKEYWETICAYLEKEKAAYKADKDKSKKKYPSYLSSDVDDIYKHLRYINTYGEKAASKKNYALYQKCLELTDTLKLSILYNKKIGKRMNILTKIYQHNNLSEVYDTAEKETLCTHTESVATVEKTKVLRDDLKSEVDEQHTDSEDKLFIDTQEAVRASCFNWKRKTKSMRYGFRLGLDPFGWSGKTYKISPDYIVLVYCPQGFENLAKPIFHKRE